MTWYTGILKIETEEEQLLIKYYTIKHSILLKIQNMMDINMDFFQFSVNFLMKKLLVEQLKMKLF